MLRNNMAPSIGQILKTAREDAGLTVADMVRTTRIRTASIQALEDGDFEVLPAAVFVRGFIRSYCREVDLDPVEILARFDADIREQEVQEETEHEETATPSLGALLTTHNGLPNHQHRGLRISHVLLLLLAIVTFIMAYATAGVSPSKTSIDSAQTEQSAPGSTKTYPKRR